MARKAPRATCIAHCLVSIAYPPLPSKTREGTILNLWDKFWKKFRIYKIERRQIEVPANQGVQVEATKRLAHAMINEMDLPVQYAISY